MIVARGIAQLRLSCRVQVKKVSGSIRGSNPKVYGQAKTINSIVQHGRFDHQLLQTSFLFFFGFGGEVAGDRRTWYCSAQVVLPCTGKKGLPRR